VRAAKTPLTADLRRAGYYPSLVEDVVDVALAGEPVVAHLVHLETTFFGSEVRRHLTALALTATRLVVTHVDDQPADGEHPSATALATSEAVPLSAVRSVALTHEFVAPERHRTGSTPTVLVLAVGWAGVSRVELAPAQCEDPDCDADHGYSGSLATDDLVLRISGEAEGPAAVQEAVEFARVLSAATAAAATP